MISIVTVIYGTNPLYELELFGSILSALSFRADEKIEVTVFTDKNLDDFPLPIKVIPIKPDDWNKWTFNGAATHLVKMHIMLEMLNTHECPVLYFDTDVIFLRPPAELMQKITPRSTLMHAYEGPIAKQRIWTNFIKHLNNTTSFSQPINPSSPMYNSGVMGMLPLHSEYMQQAIEFAQELYHAEPIFNIDQFATGTVLSAVSEIKTCESAIFHYWGWKRKFIHFALETIREQWNESGHNPNFAVLPNIPETHPLDRIATRCKYLFHRQSRKCRFAYLAFLSAKRTACDNAAMSRAWTSTCLEFINSAISTEYNNATWQQDAIKDFSYLFSLTDNTPFWLDNQSLGKVKAMQQELFNQ